MSTLAYPSADFPGQPSVALEVPEGWEPVHAPGTTMAARLPRADAFSPNVVVNIEPCEPAFRVEDSLEQLRAMAAGGFKEVRKELAEEARAFLLQPSIVRATFAYWSRSTSTDGSRPMPPAASSRR